MAEKNFKFSDRLIKSLQRKGFNRLTLAEKIGVSKGALTKYTKHGGVPEWGILIRMADELGVTADWLLTGRDPALADGSHLADGSLRADGLGSGASSDWIKLPDHAPQPLGASERLIVEKAVEVIRSPGLPGAPDTALVQNVDAFHAAVQAHTKDRGGGGEKIPRRPVAHSSSADGGRRILDRAGGE